MTTANWHPSPLTLGTVQLGMPYGVANASGMPTQDEAFDILDLAWANDVTTLDTARAYGEAEERIGHWLAAREAVAPVIVTKLPAITATSPNERQQQVIDHLAASRLALGVDKLGVVLAHRGDDLLDLAVQESLRRQVEQGQILALGGSFYDAQVALRVMEKVDLAAIQIAASIVDRRAETAGLLAKAHAAGVKVFARSAFLQGALLLEPDNIPPFLAPLREINRALASLARDWSMSLAALALLTVRDTAGISSIVVGVERPDQLADHITAMKLPALEAGQQAAIASIVEGLPSSVLDPSSWPR